MLVKKSSWQFQRAFWDSTLRNIITTARYMLSTYKQNPNITQIPPFVINETTNSSERSDIVLGPFPAFLMTLSTNDKS